MFVSSGFQHTAAVDKYCNVFTWGQANHYRLGHGDEVDATVPRQVDELDGWGVKSVQLGLYHSVALTDRDTVYAWGSSSCGQLGMADKTKEEVKPRVVDHLEGRGVQQISVGANHTAALTVPPPVPPTPPSKRGQGCSIL